MCPAHPWGLPTGLPCLGDGEGDSHRFEASSAPDGHDASEAAAERGRG